jgi:hypothetical protein
MIMFSLYQQVLSQGQGAYPGYPRLARSRSVSKTWVAPGASPGATSPAVTRGIVRSAASIHSPVHIFANVVIAFAFIVAGAAAEAPAPCANCAAEQSLPSADVVPDLPAGVSPNDPAVQAHLPGCATWTDRCVTCQRDAGKISCSNIGIACQPQAVECVRPEPVEEKK